MKQAILIILVTVALFVLVALEILFAPFSTNTNLLWFVVAFVQMIIGISLLLREVGLRAKRKRVVDLLIEINQVENQLKELLNKLNEDKCLSSQVKQATHGFQALGKALSNIAPEEENTRGEHSTTTVITVRPGVESESKD
jgi:hypothetical protein